MLPLTLLICASQYSHDVVSIQHYTPSFAPRILARGKQIGCYAGGDSIRGAATIFATYVVPLSLSTVAKDLIVEMTPDERCRNAASWTDSQIALTGMGAYKVLPDRVISIEATCGRRRRWSEGQRAHEETVDRDSSSTIHLTERARLNGPLPVSWAASRRTAIPERYPGVEVSFLSKLPTRWTAWFAQADTGYSALWYVHQPISAETKRIASELIPKGWRKVNVPGGVTFEPSFGVKGSALGISAVGDHPVELDRSWTEIRMGWSMPISRP